MKLSSAKRAKTALIEAQLKVRAAAKALENVKLTNDERFAIVLELGRDLREMEVHKLP